MKIYSSAEENIIKYIVTKEIANNLVWGKLCEFSTIIIWGVCVEQVLKDNIFIVFNSTKYHLEEVIKLFHFFHGSQLFLTLSTPEKSTNV